MPSQTWIITSILLNEKSGKLVKYGTLAWGREGEYDCEFSLNELNLNEQNDFSSRT